MRSPAVARRTTLRSADPRTLLEIYLRDHLAGAAVGAATARRSVRHARGTSYADELAAVAREIEEDHAALQTLASHLGVERPRVKQALAVAGQLAGNLKLNGQLLERSPLSQVMELEALILGVRGKLQLWKTLGTRLSDEHRPALDERTMAERAEGQLTRLTAMHATAAGGTFPERLVPSAQRT